MLRDIFQVTGETCGAPQGNLEEKKEPLAWAGIPPRSLSRLVSFLLRKNMEESFLRERNCYGSV
jgi:hypothetical protein